MAHGRQPGIITLEWAVFHSGSRFKVVENVYKSKSRGEHQSKYVPHSIVSGRHCQTSSLCG